MADEGAAYNPRQIVQVIDAALRRLYDPQNPDHRQLPQVYGKGVSGFL